MKKLLPLSFAVLFSLTVSAQEICGNGIDDNGNGLIDCYDPQCAAQNSCPGFFYGYPPISCERIPPVGPFGVVQTWQSTVAVSTRSIALVADIDNDGTPDVIAHSSAANQLYVLNGITGAVELTIACPAISDLSNAFAVADADGDGFGEIYVVDNTGVLHCFEHTGLPKAGFVNPTFTSGEVSPGIADFDGDGSPEIYIGNRIYNSQTGALIASGGAGSNGSNPAAVNAQPVAADVLPDSYCTYCDGLELVCGNTVYAVDIAGGTLVAQPNSLPATLTDGFTALADMNMDGQLDVVVTFSGKIYIWDPRTGLQIGNTFAIPNTATGGRPNIADYDNDGKPEIGVGGLNRYAVIDFDIPTSTLSLLWVNTTVDASQMTTGTTFDFEGDGAAEVVYRDENRLYVYDGATGAVKLNLPCGSGTRTEFPTIADVDGDGQADIICNCATSNQGSTGKVRVYKSTSNHWISTRKVMNEHAYHITNINDDLSVPLHEQNNAAVSKLNNFLSQSPLYDINWNPLFIPIPDLTISIDSVIYCQAPDSVWVMTTVCNNGSAGAAINFPVSFYNGNPLTVGSLIKAQSFTSSQVDTGACVSQTFSVPWNNNPFTLYAVVNDNGTNPAGAPELFLDECDSTNNMVSRNIINPVVYPTIAGLDSQYCLVNTPVMLTGSPSGGVFSGNGISGNNFTPSVAGVGQHLIAYTITNGVCIYDTTQTVSVYSFPVPDAGADVSFCSGQNTSLGNTSVNGYGYSWSPVTGISNVSASNPMVTLINSTSATIISEYILTASENGCTASDTVQVTVFAIPVAYAGVDVSFCSGQHANIGSNAVAGYTYTWQPATGLSDPAVSNPVVTLSNLASSPSVNEYIVSASENGCGSSDTVEVTVFFYPIPDAGADVSFCSSQSALIGSMATAGYSYNWQTATGLSSSSVSNPTVTLTNTSTNSLTNEYVVIVSENGCVAKDTVEVTVFAIPAADAGPDVSFCSAQSMVIGGNTVSGYTYAWQPPTGLTDPAVANPTVTLTNTAASPSVNEYIITAGENGCSSNDTVEVTVFFYPVANAGGDVSFCSAQSALIGSVATAGYSYNWQTATGLSNSSVSNPTVMLNNTSANSITNQYIVVVSENGCATNDTVDVTVKPSAVVSAGFDKSVCMVDSQISLTAFTPANGAWSGNGITDPVAGTFNPSVSGAGTQQLVYFYTDTVNGCSSGDTLLFTVFNLPLADAGTDVSICTGSSSTLFATGGIYYQWWPTQGLLGSATNNPLALPSASTTYFVQVTDGNSCSSVDSLIVFLKPVPVAGFTATNVCESESTLFTDLSQPQGNLTYWWGMGDGASSNIPIQTYNYSAPGTYSVTQIVDENGCSDTATQTVDVYAKPSMDFTAFPLSAINDNSSVITFANTSSGASQYQWSFGDGQSASAISGTHFYQDTGWYSVLLIGVSSSGCTDSLQKENYIHIMPRPLVFVPNVFTPNGDGNNDVLYLYGSAFHKISLSIYNRWGELVFETDDASIGWDGKYKGKEAPMGIYTYDLSLVFETAEARRMKGTVTLLR